MTFYERLYQDLKKSQLKKEELKVSVLRLVIASLNNKEIEKRTRLSKTSPLEKLEELSKLAKLTEEEIIETLNSEAKKRKESITSFKQGQRQELAEKEEKELVILEEYLPKPIPEKELREMVKGVITKVKAGSLADLGRVMFQLMPEIKKKGRADGNLVNQLVREFLSQKE